MGSILFVFILSIVLMLIMLAAKARELETGRRNAVLAVFSTYLDPIAGRIIDWTNIIDGQLFGNIMRFFLAKIGLWTARVLISLRNFSSKLAAHIYHTSRKAESGDPEATHPSFFIKAILEFRDKMREDKGNGKN